MDLFEELLLRHGPAAQRYVRYRLRDSVDWEDVFQEVCAQAFVRFSQLRDPEAFRPWLLAIARNCCAAYYRARQNIREIPLDDVTKGELCLGRQGMEELSPVLETLERLEPRDRQVLELYYWQEMSQTDMAAKLGIPVGTVKSRLHAAKSRFRSQYPLAPRKGKGELIMKRLPKILPEYTIRPRSEAPFPVKWEELMGYFLIPRVGEKLCWGMYDLPNRKRTDHYEMKVLGKARVHGVEGVEITARETDHSGDKDLRRVFVAQLTHSHCRYLASLRTEGEVRNYITFLDEDVFMPTWGFGDNNCGHETDLVPKGDIFMTPEGLVSKDKNWLLDIVGRFDVTINGKTYDTVCLVDLETSDCKVCSVQYIDQKGRTVLWRRFNRDDWALDRYEGQSWSQRLPDNDRIIINGHTFVHWYDCITDYIL